mgnify:CR=1 FL=1
MGISSGKLKTDKADKPRFIQWWGKDGECHCFLGKSDAMLEEEDRNSRRKEVSFLRKRSKEHSQRNRRGRGGQIPGPR